MKVVVAIGGNALVEPGGRGDITEQFARSRIVAKTLAELVIQGWQVTVTHGNGPQVGSIMRRVEISSGEVYPIDLGLAVADTQAGMGYMICQTWRNELHNRGVDRDAVAIVTPVIVDAGDPAFLNPTKPIGPFLTEAQAKQHAQRDGWKIIEDSGRGWRRIVPSPRPRSIEPMALIRTLVNSGELVVAGGGGGIPIIVNEKGEHHGVEAVIDKDFTSAIIAAEVGADALVLVTGVEHVFINFGKPNQEALLNIAIPEIERHVAENQFPPGSMLPKIQAAVQFLKGRNSPDAKAVIVDLDNVAGALAGKTGTTITLSAQRQ
ncbi:MAG TPA: carbamate kinase [Phycisphaerae bacterium]|nr:carbamate kinase [Phycisphaerae bacterium]